MIDDEPCPVDGSPEEEETTGTKPREKEKIIPTLLSQQLKDFGLTYQNYMNMRTKVVTDYKKLQ